MEKWKLFLMVLCVFFAACSEDNNEETVLIPETMTVTLAGEGDNQTIAVVCNGQWTVVSSAEWCKAEAKGLTLVISAAPNETGAELTADLTLTCGDKTAVVKVTQGVAADPINEVFAQSAQHWYFDLSGFEGAYKEAYEASVAGLVADGWAGNLGYALQWMYLTQDTIAFMIYDEDYKSMGAPAAMYEYPGTLLFSIVPVEGTRDQVEVKEIRIDPNAADGDYGAYWYDENEYSYNVDFQKFVNILMAQKYTITADNTAEPQMLTFTGVTDTGSVFKLKLQE